MKQQELISLIENPSAAIASDLNKLIELKKQFPFFQSAHLLLTLIAKKYDTGLYQQIIRQTAISIPDREQLHKLLFNSKAGSYLTEVNPQDKIKQTGEVKVVDENTNNQKLNEELDHLKAIELVSEISADEKLTEEVERHLKKDVVNAFVEKEILKTNEWYKKEGKKEEESIENAEQVQPKSKPLAEGSFTDWLKELKKPAGEIKIQNKEEKPGDKKEATDRNKETKEKAEVKKLKQQAIIDKIIENDPSRIRLDPNQRFFAADVKAKESLFENEELVTETLAKIYALQGNINKAIRAYEILSLKFPQKSAYFAALIQELKKQNI